MLLCLKRLSTHFGFELLELKFNLLKAHPISFLNRYGAYYQKPAQIYIIDGKVTVMRKNKISRIENRAKYTLDLTNLSWSRIVS